MFMLDKCQNMSVESVCFFAFGHCSDSSEQLTDLSMDGQLSFDGNRGATRYFIAIMLLCLWVYHHISPEELQGMLQISEFSGFMVVTDHSTRRN